MEIFLIRHGKTMGNLYHRYIGTTDEPVLEEEMEKLKSRNWPDAEAVFESPLLRCRQTAEIICPGRPVRIIDEFSECNFGSFENKNWQELKDNTEYQAWIDSNGTLPFPGGEDPQEFRKRCCRGFEKVVAECMRRKISRALLVVHGGTIMSIMERYVVSEKSFYDWHVKNGEGYLVIVEPSLWTPARREIVTVHSVTSNKLCDAQKNEIGFGECTGTVGE